MSKSFTHALLIWALGLVLASSGLQADPPKKRQLFLDLERNFNVSIYKSVAEENGSRPLPVHYFDVIVDDKIAFNKSVSFLQQHDPDLYSHLFSEDKRGSMTMRFFFIGKGISKIPAALRRAAVGSGVGKYKAYRIAGSESYYVWDQIALKNPTDFIVKVSKSSDFRHGWNGNSRGIRATEIYNESIEGLDSRNVAILPEVAVNQVKVAGLEMVNTIRSLSPLTGKNHRPNQSSLLLPAHGVMGNESFRLEMAKLKGWTLEHHWVEQEYLPKLALFFAELIFLHGAWAEPHMQNLNMLLNIETGEIDRMVLKDLPESAFDYHYRLRTNMKKAEELQVDKELYGLNHLFGKDADLKDFSTVLARASLVLPKSVLDISIKTQYQVDYSRIFISEFIRQVERINGAKVVLTGRAKTAYQRLFETSFISIENYSHFIPGEQPFLIGRIIEGVYQSITSATLPEVKQAWFLFDQGSLERSFSTGLKSKKIVAFTARKNLTSKLLNYAWDGSKIYAIHKITGQILGYAFGLESTPFRPEISAPGGICPTLVSPRYRF